MDAFCPVLQISNCYHPGGKKCFLRVYFWVCASDFENVSKIKQLADLWLYEQASRIAQEIENSAERVLPIARTTLPLSVLYFQRLFIFEKDSDVIILIGVLLNHG